MHIQPQRRAQHPAASFSSRFVQRQLDRRQNDNGNDNGGGGGMPTQNIAFIVVAVVLVVSFVAFIAVATWRKRKGRKKYSQTSGEDSSERRTGQTNPPGVNAQPISITELDRRTSVRSVITLPAYRPDADNGEQVLGREGERDGVDVIVELPTAEDAENLREEEMETLYQIRQTRRRQNQEREDRRRERQEAQQRGDQRALAQIRASTRAANEDHSLDELRANVGRIQENRNRSVSSVSYGELGVARHDGSRLRASSNDSERMGLLSDAASITLSTRSGAHSPAPSHTRHRRDGSVTSLDSDYAVWPTSSRSRAGSRATSRSRDQRAGSSPELLEADEEDNNGAAGRPPPEYEDVPLDDDNDSQRQRSRPGSVSAAAPISEPPPDYPGSQRNSLLIQGRQDSNPARSSHRNDSDNESASTARGSSDAHRLPTLRTDSLPEIHVIEPMSAHLPDAH